MVVVRHDALEWPVNHDPLEVVRGSRLLDPEFHAFGDVKDGFLDAVRHDFDHDHALILTQHRNVV